MKKTDMIIKAVLWLVFLNCAAVYGADLKSDWRNIENGKIIPTGDMKYADQPYVVKTKSGKWLCVMTVGTLGENIKGSVNFSASMISADQGITWTPFSECNKPYAVPFVSPGGRIFSLTPSLFTFSDDDGKTWSSRYKIPLFTEFDGWGVGKPLETDGSLILPWAMIGQTDPPRKTEVFFLKSENILTEKNPQKITWALLPENKKGLKGPEWDLPFSRSEEPHVVSLGNNRLYCVFRTDQGYIGFSASSDSGRTWSKPGKLAYSSSDTRLIKHPLACPSLWKCENGKYLLYFHNNGGKDYSKRNPAWICGGTDNGETIDWSEPEILLYSDDHSGSSGRISYPGFIEDQGKYWIFETQKTAARSHLIPASFLNDLWNQKINKKEVTGGIIAEFNGIKKAVSGKIEITGFGKCLDAAVDKTIRGGLTVEMILDVKNCDKNRTLFESRTAGGSGISIRITENKSVMFKLSDGKNKTVFECESNIIKENSKNHLVVILDGGSRVASFAVNGKLCSGGSEKQSGWVRLNTAIENIGCSDSATAGDSPQIKIVKLKVYKKYLTTSEAVGNFNSIFR